MSEDGDLMRLPGAGELVPFAHSLLEKCWPSTQPGEQRGTFLMPSSNPIKRSAADSFLASWG